MGATTYLLEPELTVEPGSEVACEVEIRNSGEIVDQFTVDVIGEAKVWATVEPATVNLLPGDESVITVLFKPPRSSEALAGSIPFGVRVQSREDPHGSTVEEGSIEVTPFTELVAELVPTKVTGRRRATYRLAIDNLGNTEAQVGIVAGQEEDTLGIKVAEPQVLVPPGTVAFVKTVARPHKRFLRGQAKSHPFELVLHDEGEEQDPLTVHGVMVQEQLLPKQVLPLLALAVVVVGAMLALWFAVLKPSVASVAKEAGKQGAKQEVQNANTAASQAAEAATKANDAAQNANRAAGVSADPDATNSDGDATNGNGNSANGDSSSSSAGGDPTSFRIQANADRVTNSSFQPFTYTAPDNRPVDVTDIVLQNPRADSGFLRIAVGDNVVLEVGLDNFRDLDYHYVVPLRVAAGQPIAVQVNCVTPGSGASQCTPSVSFSGKLGKAPAS